jgi:hypothetical protein
MAFFACVGIAGLLSWRFFHWRYDDPFITFRYAQNLLAGQGLTYNADERVLSTTTPLFAVLLAFLGLSGTEIPTLAVCVGISALAAGAYFFWQVSRQWQLPLAGWTGLLLLPLFPLVATTLGSETPLYIALLLGTLWSYSRGSFVLTALLCCCLEFLRPDGILLLIVLCVDFVFRARVRVPWRALLLFMSISALGCVLLWSYFGSPLPVTLAAKQGQGLMAISRRFAPGFLIIARRYANVGHYWIELPVALLGLGWLLHRRSPSLILLVWTALYFVAYTALGVTLYFWYYAPLVPGFVLLFGAGLQAIQSLPMRIKRPAFIPARYFKAVLPCVLLTLVVLEGFHLHWVSLFPDPRFAIYRDAGEWLGANTPAKSSVGTLEVGIVGYYSRRKMVDFAGVIQPAVARQMKAQTTYDQTASWAIRAYRPDYLLLQDGAFPQVETRLAENRCQRAAHFNARDYRAPWDLVVYRCVQ